MKHFDFREEPKPEDVAKIANVTAGTGFFRPDEVEVAAELVTERLEEGEKSGYYFWLAELDGELAGYACYGPTPCTVASFDLYWIVVAKQFQGMGLGGELLRLAEASAVRLGAARMYIETSGKDLYKPTQGFYVRAGYTVEARLTDFYDVGDDKIIYGRKLRPTGAATV